MTTQRAYYLDNLKVFLTLLVIFHHAAAGFGGPQCGWAYQPSLDEYAGAWVGNFLSVNFSYFMPLFFFISGYFVPASFDRNGAKSFVAKKLLRLGLPMLFITASLSLMVGRLEVGHGWFLQHLLLFSLLYALGMIVLRRCHLKNSSLRGVLMTKQSRGRNDGKLSLALLLLFFIIIATANFFIKRVHPSDQWYMVFGFLRTEPNHYAPHLGLFILGVIAYRKDWLNTMTKTVGLTNLILGIVLSIIVFLRNSVPEFRFTYSNWFWYEALMCVSLCFGMIYLFKIILNHSSKLLKWLSDQAFGAYILHLMILFALEYALDKVYIGSLKFAVIGILTTVFSFGLTYLIRLIPGIKI